ncbi:uncharacterized protein LOC132010145 [Mustela nigripes]|uniref:uncharacterized protein LOC132010145 n=1 Tax=Mustela nigripes TaxID=77151 RepID=UPI0028161926|nr:uncharacterized protein LOC132010145 [Mustela nigripes]
MRCDTRDAGQPVSSQLPGSPAITRATQGFRVPRERALGDQSGPPGPPGSLASTMRSVVALAEGRLMTPWPAPHVWRTPSPTPEPGTTTPLCTSRQRTPPEGSPTLTRMSRRCPTWLSPEAGIQAARESASQGTSSASSRRAPWSRGAPAPPSVAAGAARSGQVLCPIWEASFSGSEGQLKPRPRLLFRRQTCPAAPLLAPEECVARHQLPDVADPCCGSGGPGLLAARVQTVGAESLELPQHFHGALASRIAS